MSKNTSPSKTARTLQGPFRWFRSRIHQMFFADLIRSSRNSSTIEWSGNPTWQNVLDLCNAQETINEIQLALIVETGTSHPEVARVCQAGGTIVTINPVSFGYHEAPIECWQIYPEGMRALHDNAGIDTVTSVTESLKPSSTGVRNTWRLFRKLVFRGQRLSTSLPLAFDTISIGTKSDFHAQAA